MATLRKTLAAAAPHGLIPMGALHDAGQTIVLIGTGAKFWPLFTQSPEYQDGQPNPLDRWSTRILPEIATATQAVRVAYPFGGPPYEPFIRWAKDSGAAWQSPAGMLVNDQVGLMISYRGALVFDGELLLPEPATSPCVACDAPCASACPVDALSAERGYDVAACHAYLDTTAGGDCLANGCKARRACPVSQRFGRDPAQSAFHMKAFHPT